MKNALWLLAVLLLVFQKPATAGVASAMKADDLMEDCRYLDADFTKLSTAEMSDVHACISYVTGVFDGYAVGVISSGKERTMVCDVPSEVTAKEMALIVQRYIRDNPAQLHAPASAVAMKALDKAFPCKADSR